LALLFGRSERPLKYKFHFIFTFSCSLVCYKEHKSECDAKKLSSADNNSFFIDTTSNSGKPQQRIFIDEEAQEAELPVEVLSKLGDNEELKTLLQNPHLRDFLSHVNATHNPRGFMKIAMREPLFVEFADACLKVLHPGDNPTGDQASNPLSYSLTTNLLSCPYVFKVLHPGNKSPS
jgi:hypothetical protein